MTGVMTIRRYFPEDAPALAALFARTVRAVNAADYSPEQVEAWVAGVHDFVPWRERLGRATTLVAEHAHGVAGFATLESGGYLDLLFVDPAHLRNGVATRLLAALIAHPNSIGLRRIETEASITARPFFERQGFRVVREQEVEQRGVKFRNFLMVREL